MTAENRTRDNGANIGFEAKLASIASKMNGKSALCSRIAEVRNGRSLFTGDTGQGESNIQRWLIENDLVDCVVALPGQIFFTTLPSAQYTEN